MGASLSKNVDIHGFTAAVPSPFTAVSAVPRCAKVRGFGGVLWFSVIITRQLCDGLVNKLSSLGLETTLVPPPPAASVTVSSSLTCALAEPP